MANLIGYIRVSTAQQGASGLGLEAQIDAINKYTSSNNGLIIEIYREIESGTKSDRPQLAKAIKHAKRIKATLLIAKLDRLTRNVHFVSGLMESKCDFICCDQPFANRLTLHILAAVAEDEARRISQRTKDALAAAKRRGIKLGSARPNHWKGREAQRAAGLRKASLRAAIVRQNAANAAYSDVKPLIRKLRNDGMTYKAICQHLNSDGQTTVNGCSWQPMQVLRLLARNI